MIDDLSMTTGDLVALIAKMRARIVDEAIPAAERVGNPKLVFILQLALGELDTAEEQARARH
ncbi:hypothetical protein [Terrihabitans sp. B22-R8]|uniref:hypothetical protein n=1 Tax=Terrihabitans sp. B22-R8 TaxID=3425128 RepID=UPI00403CFBBD